MAAWGNEIDLCLTKRQKIILRCLIGDRKAAWARMTHYQSQELATYFGVTPERIKQQASKLLGQIMPPPIEVEAQQIRERGWQRHGN